MKLGYMNKWTPIIDRTTKQFSESFQSLSEDQMNWKPNSNIWSIAQNLDHLILINQSYFPLIEAIRNETYKPPVIARISFIVSFLGKTILNSVHPDRRKKIKTFAIWEPGKSSISGNVLDKFISHQVRLKKVIENSLDLINKKTVISSPANNNIVYRLDTAFDIMVTHEQRHLAQALEVLNKVKL